MKKKVGLEEIQIRTELKPGDIGYVVYMHGRLYNVEVAKPAGLLTSVTPDEIRRIKK